MKIKYRWRQGVTMISMGKNPELVGIAQKSGLDQDDPAMGLAVALIKAKPTLGHRELIDAYPKVEDAKYKTIHLDDNAIPGLMWARSRYAFLCRNGCGRSHNAEMLARELINSGDYDALL